jgi:glycosyltransferase involved in cell wall biosynthesis
MENFDWPMSKKRLLFVSSRFPYPLIGGFETKNKELLLILSKKYHVNAFFVTRQFVDNEDIKSLKSFCAGVTIIKPTILDIAISLIRNVFTNRPFQCSLYSSKVAQIEIKKALLNSDLAVCSVIRTADYILDFEGPKFFDLADSLWQVYSSNIAKVNGLLKLIYFFEKKRLFLLEGEIVKNSAGVFFFNKKEANFYKNHTNVHVVPHGVKSELFNINEVNDDFKDGVTFIGKMSVLHNVNMAMWFIHNVLNKLPHDCKFYLIGSNPSLPLVKLAKKDPRIVLVGFMENPYPGIRGSIACICPMQIGGGIQNKVIESLAVGALTISSSMALDALDNPEQSGVIVSDNPESWVEIINSAKNNSECFESKKVIGREYARMNFSWESYGDKINRLISLS